MTIRGKIRVLLATALAVFGLSTLMVAPAMANTPSGYLYVCNSTASRGPITAHQDVGGVRTIITGYCAQVNNSYGHTTINPDPELGGEVGGYDWGFIGHGYDYHVNGEAYLDPPNTDPDGGGSEIRMNTNA